MLPEIAVAVCADKNIEVGVHVTLYSLLASSHRPVKIYFIQKGYHPGDIETLHNTLDPFTGLYKLIVLNFDDRIFSKYKGMQGNKFTYTRIMLGTILSDERILYLDSDLVIKSDLGDMFHTDLQGHVIGASGIGSIEWSIDRDFFISIGLDKKAKYFNAGILLMDLNKWRTLKITEKCFEFLEKYANKLPAADQTTLNYVFYRNNFLELDESYNQALYPDTKPVDPDVSSGIFHFIGSPKPWDFCGEYFHRNYPLFRDYLKKTSFSDYKTYSDISLFRVKRTFRLYNSYYKCLKKRTA